MSDPASLKVAVIPAWYPTPERPMHGIFVRDQVRAAAQTNDVVVIADGGPRLGRSEGSRFEGSLEQGIRTIRVSYGVRPPYMATIGYVRGVLGALSELRREGWQPDVIHAHVYYAGLVAELARVRYRAPVVVSEHSSHFLLGTLSGADRVRARLAFGLADVVCPVSTALARAIQSLKISSRFEVVPNPIDVGTFTPSPFPPSTPARALVVAGLEPVKGIPNLLRAVGSLLAARREFCVDIVGDGPERAAYEQFARAQGAGDRVTFHGYQPRAMIARFMTDAHFVVVPSQAETFGVAMVEALAAGRPVVTTDVGIASEVVTGTSGVVVPPENPEALASAIDRMLDGYRHYSPTGLAAEVASRFSYEAVGRRWDRIYRDLARRGGGPPSDGR